MQKIPNELYDAARVDGASPIHQFWAVTLPNIRGELAVAVVITAIYALRNFDVIYNLTAGGPGYSTTVPAFEVYYEAFNYGVAGTACALAVILALIIGFIAVVMTKVTEEWGT
jgi:raffinose/stachyose/melibiose transport system permease protein